MSNAYFNFKQFTIHQDRCAMKVTTDACLFGAWSAQKIKDRHMHVNNALDIGTGTGLLSLMLAQQLVPVSAAVKIEAVEIDNEAAEQARENMGASPWHSHLFLMPGDAKDRAHTFGKKYDLILSNPPFYETELETGDPRKNQARHSPGLLLRELFTIITDLLHPEGYFYLLLPYKREEEIADLLRGYDLCLSRKIWVRQSTQHGYFRLMVEGKKGNGATGTVTEELAIWNDNQQYTQAFVELLRDYYLYL